MTASSPNTCPGRTARGRLCGRPVTGTDGYCDYHRGSVPRRDRLEREREELEAAGRGRDSGEGDEESKTADNSQSSSDASFELRERARAEIVALAADVRSIAALCELGAAVIRAWACNAIDVIATRTWQGLLEAQRRSLTSIIEEEVAALRDELEGLRKP